MRKKQKNVTLTHKTLSAEPLNTATYNSCVSLMLAFDQNPKLNGNIWLRHNDVRTGLADSPTMIGLAGMHSNMKLGKWKTDAPKYGTAKLVDAEEASVKQLCNIGDKLRRIMFSRSDISFGRDKWRDIAYITNLVEYMNRRGLKVGCDVKWI